MVVIEEQTPHPSRGFAKFFSIVRLGLNRALLQSETLSREFDGYDQLVNFFQRVIDRKAGAGGGREAEPIVQRHRAMMAVSDANTFPI